MHEIKLIGDTGIVAGNSRGHGSFLYDKIIQPLLLRTMYEDKYREEAVLKASSANWMIVRPGMLTNGKFTRKNRVLTEMAGITAGKFSRKDVANFILRRFEEPTYFKQTPLLTY